MRGDTPRRLPDLADLSKDDRMHLRMGQATRHNAQDQASRYRRRCCRFHAKSHRLQSRAHSQAHYRVRAWCLLEAVNPAQTHTEKPSQTMRTARLWKVFQQTVRPAPSILSFPKIRSACVVMM